MPKMNDRVHARKMIMYPSFKEMASVFRTKMKGKIPTMNVMTKLIDKAVNALSCPFQSETRTDRNMNNALTSSA